MIKFEKIKKIISVIAGFSSFFSLIILLWTLIIVDRIEELIDTSKDWVMELTLNEPKGITGRTGKAVRVAGKFNFWTTAAEAHHKDRVNLTMYQKSVELVCYVSPYSNFNEKNNPYYLQSRFSVSNNGSFEGLVVFGDMEPGNIESMYQILVIAAYKKSIPKGFVHANLPFHLVASSVFVSR